MSKIYEQLRADIVTALKSRDSVTALALRTADAAIQRAAMDQNKPIDDALVTAVLRKSVKTLSEAKADFEKGGRPDLAAANANEIALLEKYLPAGLSDTQLDAIIVEAIAATGATSRKDMGKVMGALKKHAQAGLIDFGAVSKLIQAKLP